MNLDNYYKLRPQMNTGDILEFHTERNPISWLIRKWTKEFNHTGIIVRMPDSYNELYERVVIYEAHGSGIDRSYLSRVIALHRGYAKWYPLKGAESMIAKLKIAQFVDHTQLRHTRYDDNAIKRKIFKKKVLVDAEELYCTELAQWALIKGGIIEDTPENRIALDPGELAEKFPEIFKVPEGMMV